MKISIVTPVLNRKRTILATIDSVKSQTYPSIEHIIQDGGSIDGTLSVIRQSVHQNLYLETEPDRGLYDGLNRGIARATGDIIGVLNSDDVLANANVLARVASQFDTYNVDGVFGDLVYVKSANTDAVIRHWHAGEYRRDRIKFGWMPPHPALYLRRNVYERLGLYNTEFRIAADYDAMLRYLLKGNIKLVYLPEVLVKMRLGGESNKNLSRIFLKSYEDYRAIRQNHAGGILTLLAKNVRKIPQFF